MVEAQTEGDAANIRTPAFLTADFVRHALRFYANAVPPTPGSNLKSPPSTSSTIEAPTT